MIDNPMIDNPITDNAMLLHYKKIIESILFVAGEPLTIERLRQVFDESARPTGELIKQLLDELQHDYDNHGIELKQLASGYCFQSRQTYATWIARLWEEKPPRYSRALLETLAIIAYRQPVTRAEIEEIRGVAVSSTIMKTIVDRAWVRVVGYRDVPGKPGIYATTKSFLDYFNLTSLDELPSLQEIKNTYTESGNSELPLSDYEAPYAAVIREETVIEDDAELEAID